MTDSLLTLEMARKRLSLSRATLYRMSKEGKIAFVKLGARTMVRESEVTRIVNAARPIKLTPDSIAAKLTIASQRVSDWQGHSANLASKNNTIELEYMFKLCAYPAVTNGG